MGSGDFPNRFASPSLCLTARSTPLNWDVFVEPVSVCESATLKTDTPGLAGQVDRLAQRSVSECLETDHLPPASSVLMSTSITVRHEARCCYTRMAKKKPVGSRGSTPLPRGVTLTGDGQSKPWSEAQGTKAVRGGTPSRPQDCQPKPEYGYERKLCQKPP